MKGLPPRLFKDCNLIGKMLFFRRQAHLCTISVRFHKENDFFKLFRLIVCFVLIKSDKNCQKKRMRDVRAKKCAPSKIVLISGLGNEDFQSFTEIINLTAKFQFVTLCRTKARPILSSRQKRPYISYIYFFLQRCEPLRDARNSNQRCPFFLSKAPYFTRTHFNLDARLIIYVNNWKTLFPRRLVSIILEGAHLFALVFLIRFF